MRTRVPGADLGVGRAPIVLTGVTKQFDEGAGVFDLDLEFSEGEFVALVGPSGAGKSTLLRMFNGLQMPDAGEVRTLGVEISAAGRRELREVRCQVGFVFQSFGLVGRLTALENVLMGALWTLRLPRYGPTTYPRHLRERAMEQLERVGMNDKRFQRCDTLSGGQQQRVAIARTLMQEPRIILADEPVASLDPETSIRVLQLLKRICSEDGLTVVCSLHQTELALQVADRIVGLRAGHLALDAATEDVGHDRLMQLYTHPGGDPVR